MRLSAGRGSYQRQLAQSSQGIIRVLTRFRSKGYQNATQQSRKDHMHMIDARTLSRRSLMAATGISAAALFTSRGLFAEETGIVPTLVKAAAGARLEIHPLPLNISVIEQLGGHIATLTVP